MTIAPLPCSACRRVRVVRYYLIRYHKMRAFTTGPTQRAAVHRPPSILFLARHLVAMLIAKAIVVFGYSIH